MKCTLLCLCALGMTATTQAEIIYSGPLSETVYGSGSIDVEIAGYQWDFGIEVGGPLDYAYVAADGVGAGVFVQLSDQFLARNFDAGDNIGTLTSVLDMYPTDGSAAYNRTMHDYVSGEGNFDATGSGYVGFGFGSGINFNYGWMHFELAPAKGGYSITLTGWAYNDVVNGSIQAGQTVVPGSGALALFGLTAVARRRRRRD